MARGFLQGSFGSRLDVFYDCLRSYLIIGGSFRLDGIEEGIALPVGDRGLAPANAALGQFDLSRERSLLDLSVECRPTEAGAIEDRPEAQKSIGWFDGHNTVLCLGITFRVQLCWRFLATQEGETDVRELSCLCISVHPRKGARRRISRGFAAWLRTKTVRIAPSRDTLPCLVRISPNQCCQRLLREKPP